MVYLVIPQTVSGVLLSHSRSPILIRQVKLSDGSDARRDPQDSHRGQTNLPRRLWCDEGKIHKVESEHHVFGMRISELSPSEDPLGGPGRCTTYSGDYK